MLIEVPDEAEPLDPRTNAEHQGEAESPPLSMRGSLDY